MNLITANINAMLLSFSFLILFPITAFSAEGPEKKVGVQGPAVTIEEKYGVQIKNLRLTAHGQMLDLRYVVKDVEKAKPFLNAEIKPYLIDGKSGTRLTVPTTPKMGSLRQKTKNPEVGRQYFMIFGNPGMRVRPDSKMTLVVGDIRIEDIPVQ